MISKWNTIKNIILKLKDLSFLSSATISANVIGGLFWIYMATLLSTEEYGEIGYYIGIATITSAITLFGAANTLIVYGAKGLKIQPVVNFIAVFSSIIGATILFVIFGNYGISVYTIGYVIFTLATSDLLGLKLYKNYAIYLVTQKIIMVSLTILFYYIFGPDTIIIAISISFFPFLPKVYRELRKTKDFSFYRLKKNFILNNYVMDISALFRGYLDKLIIAPILGFALLGNYHLGIQFFSIIGILPMIIYQYILPQESSGINTKKLKIIAVIASIILAILGYTISPILLPIFFPKFIEAIQIIKILSIALIPATIVTMFQSKYLATEKPKFIVIGSIIFVVSQISGIIILGNLFGINGIAGTMIIALSSECIYFYILDKFNIKKIN